MKRHLRTTLPWAVLLGTCGATYWHWSGDDVRGYPYEFWLQEVKGEGPNQETARDQLWLQIREGIIALRRDGAARELRLIHDASR